MCYFKSGHLMFICSTMTMMIIDNERRDLSKVWCLFSPLAPSRCGGSNGSGKVFGLHRAVLTLAVHTWPCFTNGCGSHLGFTPGGQWRERCPPLTATTPANGGSPETLTSHLSSPATKIAAHTPSPSPSSTTTSTTTPDNDGDSHTSQLHLPLLWPSGQLDEYLHCQAGLQSNDNQV